MADAYLNGLVLHDLEKYMTVRLKQLSFYIGSMLLRVVNHNWYHNGEMQAVRQLLGHKSLPDFVSDDFETVGSFFLDN